MNRLFAKDVMKISDMQEIVEGGYVLQDGNLIEVYEVKPINLVSADNNLKKKIYDTYVSVVRGFPSNLQILVTKRKDSLKPEIELYKKKILEVENFGLKIAMKKYVEYLEELEGNNEMYNTYHYLIAPSNEESRGLEELFCNLKEFGLVINKVTGKKELERILKKTIGWCEGAKCLKVYRLI